VAESADATDLKSVGG